MTRGVHLEEFEGFSVSTNVLLHVEPFPHIVLKQCRPKGLDEDKLTLSTNILLIFRLALWALALWAQMALWDLAFGLGWPPGP